MANYFNSLTNKYGKPAIAVLVRMHDHYTGEFIEATSTNRWGQFSFSNVAEGTYDFRLYGENFTEADWIYEVHIIDAVDNSGRTQNLDKTTGNFVSRGAFGSTETPEIMLDASLGTVTAKNVGRLLYYRGYRPGTTSRADEGYKDFNYGLIPSDSFHNGGDENAWMSIMWILFNKYPGESYINWQGTWNTEIPLLLDTEPFIIAASADSTDVLLSGITYKDTFGAYINSGQDFISTINISSLNDYASYVAGLRVNVNSGITSFSSHRIAWLTAFTTSENILVSGVLDEGGGESPPEPPPSGGGGKPPPALGE